MAPRGFTFVEKRAPRAAGLPERDVDEHKELIGDLYLIQNHTRDQVIQHLKTNLGLILSRDQFSKATRRWGFQKQPRAGSSIQPSPNNAPSRCATRENTREESLGIIDIADAGDQECIVTNESSKRPRSAGGSSSRKYDAKTHSPSSNCLDRLGKRMKPGNESDNTPGGSLPDPPLNYATDTDLMLTPWTEEEDVESWLSYGDRYDEELSAGYLACCYHYNTAFWCYHKISVPFQHGMYSPKQRRDRILDMARTAKTRSTSEIVREMIECELDASSDPLSKGGSDQCLPDEDEMCPRQSFLFHCHLAEIYEHRDDSASLVQKHLDKARSFTKAFDPLAAPSIDLWTLLRLLPGDKVADIPESLLNSLEWDEKSLALDMRDCLDRCWGTLSENETLPIAVQGYDGGQRAKTKPIDMSQLAIQHDPLHIWTKTSLLFTFLWTKIEDKAPPIWKHHTISPAQFLMVMSRMIVRRSLHLPQHDNLPLQSKNRLLKLRATDRRVYRSVVQVLLHEHLFTPNQIKREFVTEFVKHYSWSPPECGKSVLFQQIQADQLEALESVLGARRESRPTTSTSITLREITALGTEASEMGFASEDKGLLDWFVLPQDQVDSVIGRSNIPYAKGDRYTPSFDSPSGSSYLRTPSSAQHIHLNALNGNPTISRSLVAQSSRSSQVSVSSSLKRFKASALTRPNSRDLMMSLLTLVEDESTILEGEEDTSRGEELEEGEEP